LSDADVFLSLVQGELGALCAVWDVSEPEHAGWDRAACGFCCGSFMRVEVLRTIIEA
jgi:hypothetical protein